MFSLSALHRRQSSRAAARFFAHRIGSFRNDETGATALTFALVIPVLLAAAGAAIDYSGAATNRTKMQSAVDAAATASASELLLARSDESRIIAIATNVVSTSLQNVVPTVKVDFAAMTVQVAVETTYEPLFFRVGLPIHLRASATATMKGSMPLCLLGLNASADDTISLEKSALVTAPGCLVQSNSTSKRGSARKTTPRSKPA